MKSKKILVVSLAMIVMLVVIGTCLYRAGMQHGLQMSVQSPVGGNGRDGQTVQRKVLYWHDPMVPEKKFDKPGKSPFMDMQLMPVYADDEVGVGQVSISPHLQQNLGVRTVEARDGTLTSALHAVGSVAWNERDVALVQARANGYVERVYVRALLDPVKKGQPLADIYVPDWVAAQEDYFAARRISAELADAARQRMRLAGMTDDLIRQIEASGQVHPSLTIAAPISGAVAELNAHEGMSIASGAQLYRINGLSTVWINVDIPENAIVQLHPGDAIAAQTPAFPGIIYKGKLDTLLPQVDVTTRTQKARMELSNPSGQLVPGMFMTIDLASDARQKSLLVPSEAVIQTGVRNIVFIVADDGKFMPVEVDIGLEAGGQTEIRSGLRAGQKVVASGQFLIDSEASLKGVMARAATIPGTTPVGQSNAVGGSK